MPLYNTTPLYCALRDKPMTNNRSDEYFGTISKDYHMNHYTTDRRTFINIRFQKVKDLIRKNPLRFRPGMHALDAGCGPGMLSMFLYNQGLSVTAMDASPEMVKLAASNWVVQAATQLARVLREGKDQKMKFMEGDIENLPFEDNSFDVVCSAGVIEYLPSYSKAIFEFNRVLRPGGTLLISTTNSISPANYLDGFVEWLKTIPLVAKKFNVVAMPFKKHRHRIPTFKKDLCDTVFSFNYHAMAMVDEAYFYMLLYPRPFNRIFTKLSDKIEAYLDRYTKTPLKHLAEGYIAIVHKKYGP